VKRNVRPLFLIGSEHFLLLRTGRTPVGEHIEKDQRPFSLQRFEPLLSERLFLLGPGVLYRQDEQAEIFNPPPRSSPGISVRRTYLSMA